MITAFSLKGLHCAACKKLTEKRLGTISGVVSVNVDPISGIAKIESDQIVEASSVTKALAGTPYSII